MRKKVKKVAKPEWRCKNCKSVWTNDVKVCPNCGEKK
jgi:rRNA maturation endonuclease Nob1